MVEGDQSCVPSTLNELWTRHILDSAQLFPLASDAKHWLDIGSGGGFPGIVTACFLAEQPGGAIDLIESAGKKGGVPAHCSGTFARTGAGPFRPH